MGIGDRLSFSSAFLVACYLNACFFIPYLGVQSIGNYMQKKYRSYQLIRAPLSEEGYKENRKVTKKKSTKTRE